MRYTTKRKYERFSVGGDTLLWKCEAGDSLDIERIGNSNLIKLINRTVHKDAIFDDILFNINYYNEWKDEYLHNK